MRTIRSMSTPETSADAVEQVALGPKSVSVDGRSVQEHSIPDLIDAAKFAQANRNSSKAHRGLRFTKLVSPGGGQ